MSAKTPHAHPISYCVTCDNGPGECEHAGPRYLQPIAYERVSGGWRVPEKERERWSYEGWGKASGSEHWRDVPTGEPDTPTLQNIIESLDGIVYLDPNLSTQLHDAYELDPRQVGRLAAHLKNSTTLHHPTGFLAKRLKEMLS